MIQIWRQCEHKINIRYKLFTRNTRAKCLRNSSVPHLQLPQFHQRGPQHLQYSASYRDDVPFLKTIIMQQMPLTLAAGPLQHTYQSLCQHFKPRWAIRAAADADCRRPVSGLIAFPEHKAALRTETSKIKNGQRKQANNKKLWRWEV